MTDSPLGYWRMNDLPDNRMADSSGNGRHGHYTNVATSVTGLVAGDSDKAMQFVGNRAEVSFGTWMNATSFTVVATIVAPTASTYRNIVSRYNHDGSFNLSSWFFRVENNNKLAAYVCLGNAFVNVLSATTLVAGTTYDVAMTYDNSTMKIYINGVLEGSASRPGMNVSGQPLMIGGARGGAGAEVYNSTMDDISFIGSVLTQTQIAALATARTTGGYAAAVMAYTPLAYYRLNDASPVAPTGTLTDSSGGGHNGSYTGVVYAVDGLLPEDDAANKAVAFQGGEAVIPTGAWMNVDYYSIECWARSPGAWASNGGWLVGRDTNGVASDLDWRLSMNNGNIGNVMQLAAGGSYIGAGFNLPTPAGQIFHIVATYDGSNEKVYVNGALVVTAAASGVTAKKNTNIYIASFGNNDASANFQGDIDEIAFYGTALSAARVLAHYNARLSGAAPPGDPSSVSGTGAILKATLNWALPLSGGTPSSYEVRINGGTPVDVGGVFTYTWTGLAQNTAYDLEVRAKNPTGSSSWVLVSATTMDTSTAYDAAVMANTPLAYYRLSDVSGNALDSSGNARHFGWLGGEFTRNQPGLLVGDANTCVDFLGTGYLASGYGSLAYDAAWMNTIVGMDCLIRPDGVTGVICARDDETNRSWLFGISGQQVYVTWWTPGAGPFTLTAPTVLSTGYIAHVGASLEGGVWKIYINGVLDASSAGGQTIRTTTSPLTVGAPGYWHGNPKFDGKIDELALYSTAPTAAQINTRWVSSGSPGPVTDARLGALMVQTAVVLDDIQVHLRVGAQVVQVAVRTPSAGIKVLSSGAYVQVYYGGSWLTTRPLSPP
jgi:hypothetical protein